MDIMRGMPPWLQGGGGGSRCGRVTAWLRFTRYLDTVDTVDIVPNRFCPPSAARPRAPRRADPIWPRPGTEAALGPAAVSLMGDTAHTIATIASCDTGSQDPL